MRIVMLGTGPFAVPTFESLLASPHVAVALVTRPTREAHHRDKAPLNPMRSAAEARGLLVLAPSDINDPGFLPQLVAIAADLLVVCDYGQILKPSVLAAARLGGINLHGSLLPRYRGAAPVHWAIYHGDTETGVAVIHMTPQLDGGPILTSRRTGILPDETTAQLEPRLAELGVDAVHEAIGMLATWDGRSPLGIPQDPSQASRAPRLKKTDGNIDWRRPARAIVNQIRAFQPWPGSYTNWRRTKGPPLRLIVERASVVPAEAACQVAPGAAGQVALCERARLWVTTGDGLLSLDQLQPAGKRSLSIAEFLRGHPVLTGEGLGELSGGPIPP